MAAHHLALVQRELTTLTVFTEVTSILNVETPTALSALISITVDPALTATDTVAAQSAIAALSSAQLSMGSILASSYRSSVAAAITAKTSATPITASSSTSASIASSSTISSTVSSSSAASTQTHTSSSSKLSPGLVAVISIATFIFGIALALLCFWFCMNRRKHSAGGRSQRSFGANGLRGDKAEGIPTTSMAEQSLLDPIDDSTLKGTMAKLDNFIDQHVLGHYHEDQIQISTTQLAQAITDCNIKTSASSMPADEFARLLINPATRFHAIRRFIAWVILSNTNLDAQAAACLLPSFIVAFYNSFPPVERQAGCEEAFETALTNWKHISAFLLVENRTFREDPKLHESQIRAAIDQNVKWIHYVLAPFLTNSSKHSGEWEKNLRAIILAGAELGFTVFSQQSNWVFDWKAHSKSEAPVIVVFPALLEKAKGRTRLRIVSEAVLA